MSVLQTQERGREGERDAPSIYGTILGKDPISRNNKPTVVFVLLSLSQYTHTHTQGDKLFLMQKRDDVDVLLDNTRQKKEASVAWHAGVTQQTPPKQ